MQYSSPFTRKEALAPFFMVSTATVLVIKSLRLLHVGPVDLTCKAQQCIGLSGSSGCGKSVLLKAIADLVDSTGEMILEGRNCKDVDAPEWRQKIQLVPAESLWWHQTVKEHFHYSIDKKHLSQLSLDAGIEQQAVNQLSTGQKQRLAILRSLEKQPRVLLLDEPTASLDQANTEQVEALISEYLNTHNAAAIWVSHAPDQLKRVATNVFTMINGQLEGQQQDRIPK